MTAMPTQIDNIAFYECMQLQKFHELAQITGFHTNPDLKLIFPQLQHARSVVELGAGYGRCVFGLLEMGYTGKIYAVDRIQRLLELIEQQDRTGQVVSLHQDIRELDLPEHTDAVLWLWSGILEQRPEEQLVCLKRIYSQLYAGGKVFVDAPRDKIKYVGKKMNRKYIRVEMEWGTLEGYLPYREDIEEMAAAAGYVRVEELPYTSETGLNRMMYVLHKGASR